MEKEKIKEDTEKQMEFASIDSKDNETFEIKDVEVFASGKWNGDNYTNNDIDNMISNFKLFGGSLKIPMKLGHDPKQKLKDAFPQKDGQPALGWVRELKRDGKKLLATFAGVPLKIKDLINKGAYGRFSSEIMWNMQYLGNTFKRVLSAVSLLGADTPAVKTIDDIVGLYTLKSIDSRVGDLHAYHTLENDRKENDNMELKELEQTIKAQDEKIKSLSEAQERSNTEKAELEQKLIAKEESEKNERVYSVIDKAIIDFKVMPAHREVLASLLIGTEKDGKVMHSYTLNEKEETLTFDSNLDVLTKVFSEMPKMQNSQTLSTEGEKKEEKANDTVKDESGRVYTTDENLHNKVLKIQDEKKITYSEAYKIAIQEEVN